MNRILGIDYGEKRIGLALSDSLQIIASAYEVWENKGANEFFLELEKLIEIKKVQKIVIGLPKNMDGSLGFQAKEVQTFFEKFIKEHSELEFYFFDERRSSVLAGEVLKQKGIKADKHKGIKDAYAAAVILKDFMEYGR